MANKIRIYELARELDLDNKVIIQEAVELGISAKSHSSTVTDEEAELIKESLKELDSKKSETPEKKPEEKKPDPAPKKKSSPEKSKFAVEKETLRKREVQTTRKISILKKVKINSSMTVGDIASAISVSPEELIKAFKEFDIIVSENQKPDTENTKLVLESLDFDAEFLDIFEETDGAERKVFRPRAPVVTVMGHVDHGKTQLLDTIQNTNVIAGERGGITQHIGAYRVTVKGKGDIVFIDTPGHEAFTAMRARGAQITDMVILMVSAEDGVMPQTVEAINHSRAAGVPMIVAINKIDLPTADPKNVRHQLSQHNVLTEDWGGDVLSVEISAKENVNVDELLDMVLLQSEMMELTAPVDGPARGVVIESELDKRVGATATVIVTEGTLRSGDSFICGTAPGKIKAMTDHTGRRLKEAFPSTPVKILGFDEMPDAGDTFAVLKDRSEARKVAGERVELLKDQEKKASDKMTLEDLRRQLLGEEKKELRLILKSDVTGSLEAIKDSLTKMKTEEITISIIHSGVGAVTKKDIMLASASDAIIICFNISIPGSIKKEAETEGIQVRNYRIIYEIIDDIEKALEGMLSPEESEVSLGRAGVKKVYNISGVGTIAGSSVISGVIKRNAPIRVIRDSRIIFEGRLANLKRFKNDASEVAAGFECGINVERFNDIHEGDILESYEIQKRQRTLSEAR